MKLFSVKTYIGFEAKEALVRWAGGGAGSRVLVWGGRGRLGIAGVSYSRAYLVDEVRNI